MPDQPPQEYHLYDPDRQELRVVVIHPPKKRYWLHALLFLATVFTTLCIGAHMQDTFNHNLGLFSQDDDLWPFGWILADWHRLKLGIPFSACLLGILGAHELGHYVLCVRRKVFATLPFFIPWPVMTGTFGAFIRIRSPIRSRADLFDIGIAGPIAGFIVAVPVLIFALLASKPLTGEAATNIANESALALGVPLIFKLAQWLIALGGSHAAVTQVPIAGLYLHPAAMAAWIGMLATSLNLLPGGQLDGGHIVFAVNPRWHRIVSWVSIISLALMSWFLWAGWLLWAVILRFTGSHPDVPLAPALDAKRRLLAIFALIMLAVTLMPSPFPGQTLERVLQQYRHDRQQQSQPAK